MDSRSKVTEAQKATIDHLAVSEDCLGDLYVAYADAFPAARDFWLKLVDEEQTHARLLRSLHKLLDRGGVLFEIGRFSKQVIDALISRIDYEQSALARQEVSALQAMVRAVALEDSIIEAKFYDVVKSDAPEFRIMAEHLSRATRVHRARISCKLAEMGGT